MNKQELIESIAHLPSDCSRPRPMIDKITALELIKLLDEPQKVTVPQLVADWYEEHKENFDSKLWAEIYKFGTVEKSEFAKWVYKTKNSISTIVNMYQFGYTVDKEPKYTVKIKSVNQYLVRNTDEDFLGFLQSRLKSKFTRKELEDAGLEEVFNSPLFEVEEVEG
ncbi:DUF1642 domain-containing protein [Streptococcus sp. HMSC072G04]|uniref:DUF1642 domain-containing protein n=1 Tax=Streptococcus sp. HMSC072G04 TaxID=1739408 RepID=UPI0008A1CC7F|nr:DUF1642 domain-containing protein [Streptococcus sp. HMSC072G04]OFR15886.1 hypothetical protein HMPREF2904_02455 [Streptococcus sp. HMSC072G04]